MAAEKLIAAYKDMAVWAFSEWFYLIVLVRAWHDGAKRHRLPPEGWQQNARL